jgi:AraC-like DNA-binding protein
LFNTAGITAKNRLLDARERVIVQEQPSNADRIMMTISGKTQSLRFQSGANPQPLLSSAGTDWAGLPFEVHQLKSAELNGFSGPRRGEHGVVVVLSGQFDMLLRKDNRDVHYAYLPGMRFIISGDHPYHVVKIDGSAELAALHISQQYLTRSLLDIVPYSFGANEPKKSDETVYSLTRAIRDEVAAGSPTGRLYAEALSMALLSYIAEHTPTSNFNAHGGFSEAQSRRLRRYIMERLHEELTLSDLASVAKISPRHFCTLFLRSFGITPHQYVLKNRLAEAARKLETENPDITDLALNLGFSSQSHFAAAFRRAFGTTPRKYAIDKRKSICMSKLTS